MLTFVDEAGDPGRKTDSGSTRFFAVTAVLFQDKDEANRCDSAIDSLRDRLRVIHTSPPFGMPPLVVGPSVRPQTKAQLQQILLGMTDDPQGRQALRSLGADRFVPARDEDYDSVRALGDALGKGDSQE